MITIIVKTVQPIVKWNPQNWYIAVENDYMQEKIWIFLFSRTLPLIISIRICKQFSNWQLYSLNWHVTLPFLSPSPPPTHSFSAFTFNEYKRPKLLWNTRKCFFLNVKFAFCLTLCFVKRFFRNEKKWNYLVRRFFKRPLSLN